MAVEPGVSGSDQSTIGSPGRNAGFIAGDENDGVAGGIEGDAPGPFRGGQAHFLHVAVTRSAEGVDERSAEIGSQAVQQCGGGGDALADGGRKVGEFGVELVGEFESQSAVSRSTKKK